MQVEEELVYVIPTFSDIDVTDILTLTVTVDGGALPEFIILVEDTVNYFLFEPGPYDAGIYKI